MKIDESIYSEVINSGYVQSAPASKEKLNALEKFNVKGATLDYFAKFNLVGEKNMISIDDADGVLEMAEDIGPNCDIWPAGFIGFARDFEGRTYFFDQNTLDEDGNPRIVRIDYPYDEEISDPTEVNEGITAEYPNISIFLQNFMEEKL